MPLVCTDIVPCQKADTAYDDQKNNGNVYRRIPYVSRKRRVFVFGGAEYVKAGVAKGGNRMKCRHPNSLDTEVSAKCRQHDDHSDKLDQKSSPYNKAGQADDPADLRGRDGVLHGTALHQRYFSAGQHSEKCRNCYNTEPAYLDQQQYYRLPESGPITARILHNQPRNANGGGRCEQRLVKRRNNSGSR